MTTKQNQIVATILGEITNNEAWSLFNNGREPELFPELETVSKEEVKQAVSAMYKKLVDGEVEKT